MNTKCKKRDVYLPFFLCTSLFPFLSVRLSLSWCLCLFSGFSFFFPISLSLSASFSLSFSGHADDTGLGQTK